MDDPKRIEAAIPNIIADAAVFCGKTGIVDPYEYSRSLQVASEEKGASFILNSPILAIERLSNGVYRIETPRGQINSEIVVNCAGLHSDEIAMLVGINRYRIYPWRGDYFRLRSPHRFESLIYPTRPKGAPGLGVHLTLSLDGSYRLGPDAHPARDKTDFATPETIEAKKLQFFDAARTYLRRISIDQLQYDSCGIRPKLRSPEDTDEKDFVLSEDLPGFINLIGIESPGLTAAIDLAERTACLVKG
jgi:L-2-hydroxyglutarate oxidase LhgO